MRLSRRDLTSVVSALPALYAPASLCFIPQKILLLITALVPCLAASYDELDVDRWGNLRGYRVEHQPVIQEVCDLAPSLPQCIHTHPLFPFLQQRVTRPLKISDVATRAEFRRTRVYNEFYRLIEVDHQMIWFLPGKESPHVCVTMVRQRSDFSERDRQILQLLSPHLRQAHRNAQVLAGAVAAASTGPERPSAATCELLPVDTEGHPRALTKRAAEWLRAYFAETSRVRPWPERLRRWIRRQQWSDDSEEASLRPRPAFVIERAGGCLTITFLPGRDGAGLLVLNERSVQCWSEERLGHLPLTAREREIFRWICEGKTNPEMARILNISRRTVDKHIEHLLGKLGLENRHQVQRLGWELCQPS